VAADELTAAARYVTTEERPTLPRYLQDAGMRATVTGASARWKGPASEFGSLQRFPAATTSGGRRGRAGRHGFITYQAENC